MWTGEVKRIPENTDGGNHKHADKREKSQLAAAVCVAEHSLGEANLN